MWRPTPKETLNMGEDAICLAFPLPFRRPSLGLFNIPSPKRFSAYATNQVNRPVLLCRGFRAMEMVNPFHTQTRGT